MASSKSLFMRAKKIIPSGINSPVRYYSPYPFFVKKAKGSMMWDVDGNKYLDFCNAYGALLLGHLHKEIISDVKKQMEKGTLYCAPTEIEIKLSELVSKNL
ncbi:MAG: aminotransferase class III-fold pyridoxal phosphate-dependent enzyme, partial [Thaumarchaeota archaeon]|nr:aminotransferase class III-fold pyridoxal phosphate-dependent enzyme [Nitrososphaerota archaeon]